MPVARSDLGRGDAFGDFVIGSELGRGAMGVVYDALQTSLGRRVALKLITDGLAEDPRFRARFEQEARALASLDSRHVVGVYTFGDIGGQLFIATQLIDGGDVGALMSRAGPLPLADAVDVAEQVAAGLVDAHRVGLVHRDVKPGNVLLRRTDGEWQAFLCDFGVVRPHDSEHTRTGAAVGTPSYMAPEVHTGARATQASDVYAVGCLLWAMVTGRAPYEGGTPYALALAHLQAPVPQLPPGPGDGVNAILRRAMAKDPAARYRSAADLRHELGAERRRLAALPPTRAPLAAPTAPPAPPAPPVASSEAPTAAAFRPPPGLPTPGLPAARRRRGAALLALVAVLLLSLTAGAAWWVVSAGRPDQGAEDPPNPTSTSPGASSTGPTTSGSTSVPVPVDGLVGDGCADLPSSGRGSLADLAGRPLAAAVAAVPATATFASVLDAAGIQTTLDAAEDVTVFAPTDEAFAALPQDVLAAVLQDPDLSATLVDPHVVAGPVASDRTRGYSTVDGGRLQVTRDDDDGMAVSTGTDAAVVVCGNIPTANGRLYLIDTVLTTG